MPSVRSSIPSVSTALAMTFSLAAASLSPAHSLPPPSGVVETVALFDPAQLETPESLVFDRAGNAYVSLALTGEVRKLAPDGTMSTHAFLPIGSPLTPCHGFIGILGALAIDDQNRIYAAVAACDPANRGIWRIEPNGASSLVANLPIDALPNGISLHRGRVYVADSAAPRIWTTRAEVGAPKNAEIWLEDPILSAPPLPNTPGGNGLQIFRNELYIAISGAGTIVAVPFERRDDPGIPRVHATLPVGVGCDDFAFDVRGSIYCTTDPTNLVIRLDPDGSSEILLTAGDGLDGPTAATFGRRGLDRFELYITNAAFPFFTTTFRPSLMRLRLDVPGAPRGR